MTRLVSINVGGPREVEWQGKLVRTSIFKSAVRGPVRVGKLNLEGDQQSDLNVHGGIHKAVYAYPSEHYAYWRAELPGAELPWGIFGENLTTEGLIEAGVKIGDRLTIGTAEFMVVQPRFPCFKLGVRFGDPEMVLRFRQSRRNGFYLSVLREGSITAGDSIRVEPSRDPITIADVVELRDTEHPDMALLRRACELESLAPVMRDHLRRRLDTPADI